MRIRSAFLTAASIALAAVVLPALPAAAAGAFDGTWHLDAPGAGSVTPNTNHFECPPVHITMEVQNGQVHGTLQRSYGNEVINGLDRNAAPVTGSIDDQGNVEMKWKNYTVKGKAVRGHMTLDWKGECGPRTAVGTLY